MRLSEMEARDWNEHEPEGPVETETSEHLERRTFKDMHIEWFRKPHDPIGYDGDCWEEAYELGLKAFAAELNNLRANRQNEIAEAQARGAFQAARTAYERTPYDIIAEIATREAM